MDTLDADRPADSFPLTEVQYAYWVGREPDFVLGNVAPNAYFELEGRRLDHTLLTNAWRHLVRRHEMLRTVVLSDGRQRVLPSVPDYEIEYNDLRDIDPEERNKRLAVIREEMSGFVYSAERWPLFDIRLTRLPEHDQLHISFDRLVVDLASVALLLSEWSALCMRPEQALPPVDVTFQDYVHSLDQTRGTPQHRRALEYWAGRAEALAPPPDLPLACSPASVHKPVFTHRAFTLAPDAWQRFQSRAEERGLTPSAVLATAFGEVLRLWSGTSRFTLNLTLFNRLPVVLGENAADHRMEHPHLQRVVGDFTSICLLDMDMAAGLPFAERARQAQRQLQQDLRHRHVSALHALRERRRRGLQAGFDTIPVMFTSGLGTVTELTEPLEYFGEIGYRVTHTPQVWLDNQAVDITGSLELSWDAVDELFPDGLLDDMFAAYRGLVERLANAPDRWTDDIVVGLPDHQADQRKRVNDTASAPPTGLLHEPFLAQVPLRPRQPAIITSTGTVDYAGLAAAAHAVAAHINPGAEPGSDDLVGVVASKSIQQVVGAYGVLLAGKAYLPVNPNLPNHRLHQILADGDVTVAVTTANVNQSLEWPADVRRVNVPDRWPPAESGHASAPALPDDLAYVIYTSGSTGQPKGVMIEHRAALNTVVDINKRFGVRDTDRVFGLADLSFDLSVYDLFGTHAAGATLVLPDADKTNDPAHWAEMMTEHGVTVWNSVPAQMQMLVEYLEANDKIPPNLRLVMLSGDWIPVDLPDRIHDLWPEADVISLGGATEASIWSIYHPVTIVDPDALSIPYGKPLLNQAFHVLNERLEPCPTWVIGELFIEGYGLARGYWKNPEKTAASFIEHPRTGVRLYRTGDFGRYLPGGEIQFLGRRDGQVKIGGHRVEVGEVEAVLQRHPGVQQAVVVKSDDSSGSARLNAYVTLTDSEDSDLFVTERGDPQRAQRLWQGLEDVVRLPAPRGPDGPALLSTWDRLNELHAIAVAVAFRRLGLPHRPGDVFDGMQVPEITEIPERYARWVDRAFDALIARGHLESGLDGLTVAHEFPTGIPEHLTAEVRRDLREVLDVGEDVVEGFLSVVGNLAGVLTEDSHSADLHANDLTPTLYARLFDPSYRVAVEGVRRAVTHRPGDRPLRVLEVGAGYGPLTRHLLPLLPDEQCTYVFTDTSPAFLGQASSTFADFPFMSYEILDPDRPPQTQGFDEYSADLIIAASALHNTRRIGATLRNLRAMLAPDGLLVLVEQTAFHPWFDLTMGLRQGFDSVEDTALRPRHPLLDKEQWRTELALAGFADSMVLTHVGGPAEVGFDVIVARGPSEYGRFDPDVLRAFVGERLPKHMVPARVSALAELPLSRTGKIDRATLAQAGTGLARRNTALEPPRTDRQRKLVEIWRVVLGIEEVGITDDFLESGGDSLLATRLVASIRTAFGIDVSVSAVLAHPSVEALDGYLEKAAVERRAETTLETS